MKNAVRLYTTFIPTRIMPWIVYMIYPIIMMILSAIIRGGYQVMEILIIPLIYIVEMLFGLVMFREFESKEPVRFEYMHSSERGMRAFSSVMLVDIVRHFITVIMILILPVILFNVLHAGGAEGNTLETADGITVERDALEITDGITVERDALEITDGITVERNAMEVAEGITVEGDILETTEGNTIEGNAMEMAEGIAVEGNALEIDGGDEVVVPIPVISPMGNILIAFVLLTVIELMGFITKRVRSTSLLFLAMFMGYGIVVILLSGMVLYAMTNNILPALVVIAALIYLLVVVLTYRDVMKCEERKFYDDKV